MLASDFSHTVLHYLGFVLKATGLMLLVPIIPGLIYGETITIIPFLMASAISLIWGIGLTKYFRKGELTLGRSMVMAALAFLFMALMGAIPFFALSDIVFGEISANSYVSAYFESMSGFTTTGLSVIPDLSVVPRSLLFWRSFTQWIGGIGIIILFLTVLKGPGLSSTYLYKGEAHEERLEPSVRHTARNMLKIYALYTVLGIIVMIILGMPIYDSIIHILATVSTGGFSHLNAGVAAYNSFVIEIGLMVFMFIGATSFYLHYRLLWLRGFGADRIGTFMKSLETKILLVLIIIFTAILSLSFYLSGLVETPFRMGLFQVLSSFTSSGYSNMDYAVLSGFDKLIMSLMMFIGGSSGSTAGGLKIVRLILLLMAIPWLVRKYMFPPTAITKIKVGIRTFEEKELMQVALYFFIYMFFIFIGSLVLTVYGFPLVDALFETISATATVGLSVGVTSYALAIPAKLILIFEMWIGRLEIIPVIVWIGSIFERSKWTSFYK